MYACWRHSLFGILIDQLSKISSKSRKSPYLKSVTLGNSHTRQLKTRQTTDIKSNLLDGVELTAMKSICIKFW